MRVMVTNAALLVLALVLALALLLLLRLTIESVTRGYDNSLSSLRVRCWFAELRRRAERYSGRVVDSMPDASQEGKDGASC